ncbi:gasdermin-A [Ornithorhynchus anatinus]|uniref:gasdermin-A n=1 Tax=Ornithorhynchus anatinus TaxID=9258 RepID=UPI0001554EB4|nr:gasdermin-A [Ornithorhynchus anatinus]
MTAMFENVTRALARQLNPQGDLTPLDSLIDFKRFRPLCLVLRKRKGTLFWGARYLPTDYALLDLLEPGAAPTESTDNPHFRFKKLLDLRLEGKVDVPNTVKVTGGAGLTQSSHLEVQTLSVAPKALDTLRDERKLLPEHPFLQELRPRGENLYVVMETVETVKEVTLERAGQAQGGFSIPLLAPLGLQGSLNHQEAVTIPQDCVLAFRVRQLVTKGNGEWDIPHVCDEKLKTFPPEGEGEASCISLPTAPPAEVPEDFGALQEEVESEARQLAQLTPEARATLLRSLRALLGKNHQLRLLEGSLEGALHKGTPGALEDLGNVTLSPQAMGSILYFLGALTELSEAQQKLLAQSMEKKILLTQLKLVERAMEENFQQSQGGDFPLPPQLLSSLGDEDLTLTEALVGLSGLELHRAGPRYTWEPATLPRLCALYAGLSALHLLAAPAS